MKSKRGSRSHANPPQLGASITAGHRFRFSCNREGGGTSTIKNRDLIDLICLAVTSTSAYTILDSVKLKEIEIWAANGAGNASNTAELEFVNENALFGGPGTTYSDTAIGVSNICHIYAKPPKNSVASMWCALSDTFAPSVDLFRLTVPQGAIVDVVVSLVLRDNDAADPVVGSVVGATPGHCYYRYLDSTTNQYFVPISADYI